MVKRHSDSQSAAQDPTSARGFSRRAFLKLGAVGAAGAAAAGLAGCAPSGSGGAADGAASGTAGEADAETPDPNALIGSVAVGETDENSAGGGCC